MRTASGLAVRFQSGGFNIVSIPWGKGPSEGGRADMRKTLDSTGNRENGTRCKDSRASAKGKRKN